MCELYSKAPAQSEWKKTDTDSQNADAKLVIVTTRLANATLVIAGVGIVAFGAATLQWCALHDTAIHRIVKTWAAATQAVSRILGAGFVNAHVDREKDKSLTICCCRALVRGWRGQEEHL